MLGVSRLMTIGCFASSLCLRCVPPCSDIFAQDHVSAVPRDTAQAAAAIERVQAACGAGIVLALDRKMLALRRTWCLYELAIALRIKGQTKLRMAFRGECEACALSAARLSTESHHHPAHHPPCALALLIGDLRIGEVEQLYELCRTVDMGASDAGRKEDKDEMLTQASA